MGGLVWVEQAGCGATGRARGYIQLHRLVSTLSIAPAIVYFLSLIVGWPDDIMPQALITVGWPAGPAERISSRLDMDQIVKWA